MAANLTQILNFKANFQEKFELFSKKKYAYNGGQIVNIIKKKQHLSTKDLIISSNS